MQFGMLSILKYKNRHFDIKEGFQKVKHAERPQRLAKITQGFLIIFFKKIR